MLHQNWPEYGIGLVFTDDAVDAFVAACGYEEPSDLIYDVEAEECKHGWVYFHDEVEGKTFDPFEGDTSENPSQMFVIYANKQPDPFEAKYPNGIQELIAEFKDDAQVAKKLPKDFDWAAHLGYFSGSFFC